MNIVVTGGSTGIGKVCVDYLSKQGHEVLTCSRSMGVDLGSHDDLNLFIEQIFDRFNNVDILINNAAVYQIKDLVNINYEEWDYYYRVNVYAPFLLMNQILPRMRSANTGRVVNLVSTIALAPKSGRSLYASSKAALITLTKTAALEMVDYGIKINAFCPGHVKTDMNSSGRSPYFLIPAIDFLCFNQNVKTGKLYRDVDFNLGGNE